MSGTAGVSEAEGVEKQVAGAPLCSVAHNCASTSVTTGCKDLITVIPHLWLSIIENQTKTKMNTFLKVPLVQHKEVPAASTPNERSVD